MYHYIIDMRERDHLNEGSDLLLTSLNTVEATGRVRTPPRSVEKQE